MLFCLASRSSNQGYGVQQSVRAQQQIGSVASIQILPQSSMNGTGGALLGAVLGGVVGNQFGGGSGRALATGVGGLRCRQESDSYAKSTGQPDLPSLGQAR
ncbi:MAG: glycine zipper 2TM domain-containing protein [Rheinheimera sp.]|nr:glycine zipper 2TM domain-containing protein [Rheinheimera sp.]